jgi:hypothetical protein
MNKIKILNYIKKIILVLSLLVVSQAIFYPEEFRYDGPIMPAIGLTIIIIFLWNKISAKFKL